MRTGQRGVQCSCYASSASSVVRSSRALRSLRKHNDDDRVRRSPRKSDSRTEPFCDTQPFTYLANIKKAFPSVDRDSLWVTLKRIGVPSKPISIVDRRAKHVIKLPIGTSDEYELQRGLREICPSSTLLFTLKVSN